MPPLPLLLLALIASVGAVAEDDVVVRGERDPADPKTSGSSVTTVTIDERLGESDDLSHAVARAPGTTVRRLGGLGSFSTVSLRGAAARQVAVFIDGLPLNPDGSAAVNLSELPLRAFDRVEVWRGAGPASLAASPIGGVVSLHTKPEAQAPLSMAAGAGSWGSWTGSVSGSESKGPVRIMGVVSGLSSRADYPAFHDNGTPEIRFDDTRERRQGNDRHQLSGLMRLSGNGWLDWSGLGALTRREEGIPGPVGSAPDGRLETTWAMASFGAPTSSTGSVRSWVQVRDELRKTPLTGDPDTLTNARERFYQVGGHSHQRLAIADTLSVGATVQGRADLRRGSRPALAPAPSGSNHRLSLTSAVDAHWVPSPRFAMDPVLNVQVWSDGSSGTSTERAAVNPRISTRFTASKQWILHGAGGRAVRPPDFLELFGDRGSVQGRPNLRPERGWWGDAGVRWLPSDSLRTEANFFVHDAVNRIVFIQNAPNTVVPINVGRSRSAGVELAADARIGSVIDVAVNGTWTEARNLDGSGTRLPRIPALAGRVDLGIRLRDRARLAYGLDATGPVAWDTLNRFEGPPRAFHALSLYLRPRPEWPSLTLEARNLGDQTVQVTPLEPSKPDGDRVVRPVTDFAGYPLPGRTFMLTVRWTPGEAS